MHKFSTQLFIQLLLPGDPPETGPAIPA